MTSVTGANASAGVPVTARRWRHSLSSETLEVALFSCHHFFSPSHHVERDHLIVGAPYQLISVGEGLPAWAKPGGSGMPGPAEKPRGAGAWLDHERAAHLARPSPTDQGLSLPLQTITVLAWIKGSPQL